MKSGGKSFDDFFSFTSFPKRQAVQLPTIIKKQHDFCVLESIHSMAYIVELHMIRNQIAQYTTIIVVIAAA